MNTVGGVIAAGDPIMLIVPESDNLMAEVKVDPKDIDQVQFGQPVGIALYVVQCRDNAGTQRHGVADRGGYHHRPADGSELLSRANLHDG